jgi:signal transduction histidine kinase
MRRTDAAEVVNTTTEGFRPMAQKSGVSLTVHMPAIPGQGDAAAPEVAVAADPDRLAQLLANLIENALSFARQSVVVTLFESRPEDRQVRVEVEDDGPGIAPEDLTRVFERFYRADRGPRRQLGSGLGLAIVSQLASAMGARVLAESPTSAGGGSRFVVVLAAWDGRS